MRILVVTNLYPSPETPSFGPFVATRVEALRRLGADVIVVAITDTRAHRRIARKYASLLGRAVAAAFASRRPGRRVDVVEVHIAYPTGLIGAIVSRIAGAPLVLFAHGSDVLVIPRRSPVHLRLARWTYRRARIVVANSRYLADALAELVPGIASRTVVESPGLDLTRFGAVPAGGDGPAGERQGVLFVGRLVPGKGADILLRALALIPPDERPPATIIGSGPEAEDLRSLARASGVSVAWRDAASRDEIATAMRQALVVVAPSRVESLGLVPLEAMAAGALVVASSVGGLVETVEHGRTGLLVPVDDELALAAAIRGALAIAADAEKADRIRSAAFATAAKHDVDSVARRSVRRYAMLSR
jgi:glycosyltransferase involved in cell wall biosynthesis